MIELWLKFYDENGDERRVPVEAEKFVIGRHSENDLSIPNVKLSRQHVKIERFDDIFVVSDSDSTNGTELNEQILDEPQTLKNGDVLNLGGGLDIEIELVSGDDQSDASAGDGGAVGKDSAEAQASANSIAATSAASMSSGAATGDAIPMSFFILAPVFGLVILFFFGAIIFVFSGNGKTETAKSDDFVYSSDSGDETSDEANDDIKKTPEPTGSKEENRNAVNSGVKSTPEPDNSPIQVPKNQTDTAKIETNSASFLRRIAQNDPQAFLTSEQARAVESKIKQFSNSAALADNIKTAKSNAAQINQLAAAKNLKPQFLAVAALAKIGNNRGSVLQTAQTMTETLEKLDTQLGSEFSSDALLVIAAYEQGTAGEFLRMRNMLQQLSNEYSESSRTIRTIWFLHKKGKISDAQYDFALRFLAIGTITQNPKDFGVNAEELKFN